MELVSGKITLTLRDFSNGRGDMAITAHYNLDIADSEWIFEMSKPQNLREQAGLEKDIIVSGVFDRCEIWDRQRFEKMDAEADEEELIKALEGTEF